MSSLPSLPSISLPPHLASFVHGQVESGNFKTESEVVQHALSLMQQQSMTREQRLEKLRAEIQIGVDQLDRGDCGEWNADEVWAEVERRLESRKDI